MVSEVFEPLKFDSISDLQAQYLGIGYSYRLSYLSSFHHLHPIGWKEHFGPKIHVQERTVFMFRDQTVYCWHKSNRKARAQPSLVELSPSELSFPIQSYGFTTTCKSETINWLY